MMLFQLSILTIPCAYARGDEPVAMVTDFQGDGVVINEEGKQRLEILHTLAPGNRITLLENSIAVLAFYTSGKEYQYRGPAEITIGPDQPSSTSGLDNAPRDLNIVLETGLKPNRHPSQAALSLRGNKRQSRKVELLSPRNTKLLNTHPTFTWKSLNDAEQYHLTLFDEEGKIIIETNVTDSFFTLPSSVAMTDGAWYSWKIVAKTPNGIVNSTMTDFRLASTKDRKKLEQLNPGVNGSFSDMVLYTSLLQQAGFYDEANRYWKELANKRPEAARLQYLAEGAQ